MGKFKLYPYQENAVQNAVTMLYERGNSLIVAATGAGKTLMLSAAIGRFFNGFYATNKRKPHILVLVHRTEIHGQNHSKFSWVCPEIPTSEITASRKSLHGNVHFGMVQTVVGLLDEFEKAGSFFDLIVIDECFPANTGILTNKGIKHIKDITIGDTVMSYNHETNGIEFKPVLSIFRSNPKHMVSVLLANGEKIACTAGHPFFDFAKGEYVSAKDLTSESVILRTKEYSDSELYGVWTNHSVGFDVKVSKEQMEKSRTRLLFSNMLKRILPKGIISDNGKDKSKVRQCANDDKQSYEKVGYKGKSFCQFEINRASTESKGRERQAFTNSTSDIAYCIDSSKSPRGIRHTNQNTTVIRRLSDLLQGGHCHRRNDACDRNRRQQPYSIVKKGAGREENGVFDYVRVDSITVHKQASDGTFGGLCSDSYVYNIEVEGNNNYFANGILVHNCHHSAASTHETIIGWNLKGKPDARLLGVTATPNRGDKLPLVHLFDNFCQITSKFLIDSHYLVRPRFVDLSPVFELEDKQEKGHLSKNCKIDSQGKELLSKLCDDYLREKEPGKSIIFAPSHEFCIEIYNILKAKSRSPSYLSLGLDDVTRKSELERFENGDAEELINVDICTEGYDYPALRNVVDFDTNGTHGQYIQKVGRCLRTAPGKTSCTVLDFGGNIEMYPDGVETNVDLDGVVKNPKGEKLTEADLFRPQTEAKETSDYELGTAAEHTPYHTPKGFETVNDADFGIVFVACGTKRDCIIVGCEGDFKAHMGDKASIKRITYGSFNECVREGLLWLGEQSTPPERSISNMQIRLLAPEYPTTALTWYGANCTICWKVFKESIKNQEWKG